MTYCNYAIVQLLTSYTWRTQRSIELLLGAQRIRWRPAKSELVAPMFEPEVFRKQMYCTEVLVALLRLFGAPQSFGALIVIRRPGNCAPYPRRYAPDYCAQRRASTNHSTQLKPEA